MNGVEIQCIFYLNKIDEIAFQCMLVRNLSIQKWFTDISCTYCTFIYQYDTTLIMLTCFDQNRSFNHVNLFWPES